MGSKPPAHLAALIRACTAAIIGSQQESALIYGKYMLSYRICSHLSHEHFIGGFIWHIQASHCSLESLCSTLIWSVEYLLWLAVISIRHILAMYLKVLIVFGSTHWLPSWSTRLVGPPLLSAIESSFIAQFISGLTTSQSAPAESTMWWLYTYFRGSISCTWSI